MPKLLSFCITPNIQIIILQKIPSHEKTTSGKLMPLLFLSAPGIGTRYSDSYSEHLPAVVRSRKREAIITYKKIRPMIQLGNLSYRLISPYNDRGAFSLMLYTPQKNMPCSCLQDSALLQSDCSPFPHGQAESRQAIPHHGTKPEKMPVRCHWTTKCSPEEY